MKLYATTTSERASKGQGGNKYLRVYLTVGNSKEQADAGVLELIEISPDKYAVRYHLRGKSKLLQEINTKGTVFETKDKQKKDEVIEWYKENTGKSPDCPHYINSDKYNPDGWKFCTQCKKGKQKKGEAPCMNCGSIQKEKDIDYLGDSKWDCPNCR